MPEAGGQGSMGGDEASEARRQTGVRVVWPALWNGWKRGRGDEQTETSSLQGCHPVGCLRSEVSPAGVKVPSVRSHSRSEPGGRERQESSVQGKCLQPGAHLRTPQWWEQSPGTTLRGCLPGRCPGLLHTRGQDGAEPKLLGSASPLGRTGGHGPLLSSVPPGPGEPGRRPSCPAGRKCFRSEMAPGQQGATAHASTAPSACPVAWATRPERHGQHPLPYCPVPSVAIVCRTSARVPTVFHPGVRLGP